MLGIVCEDRVEDPVEAEDYVDDHRDVIVIGFRVPAHVAQVALFGVRLAEGPVHEEVPKRCSRV